MGSAATKRTLRLSGRLLTAILVISAGITVWANIKRNVLPPESTLLSDVEDEPVQKALSAARAFSLRWRGADFQVYPQAEYEISGMVVTRNDIGGFSDIYHTANSVDVLDVCLVWGDNTDEKVYQNIEFWSEPFSCWERPKNAQGRAGFNADQLSNTHLLAKDEALAKRLNAIRLGDQIRLTGKLVNYHPAGASEQLRRSSLVRSDRGNGACEVMYVEDFTLLERGNAFWNDLFSGARLLLLITFALKAVSLLLFPYLEYRAM